MTQHAYANPCSIDDGAEDTGASDEGPVTGNSATLICTFEDVQKRSIGFCKYVSLVNNMIICPYDYKS